MLGPLLTNLFDTIGSTNLLPPLFFIFFLHAQNSMLNQPSPLNFKRCIYAYVVPSTHEFRFFFFKKVINNTRKMNDISYSTFKPSTTTPQRPPPPPPPPSPSQYNTSISISISISISSTTHPSTSHHIIPDHIIYHIQNTTYLPSYQFNREKKKKKKKKKKKEKDNAANPTKQNKTKLK